ncbi:MAG: hypothetical protein U1E31_00360 [Rickettsiales bacterium]
MISKEQQTVMEILYSEDYSADSFILNKYNHDAFVALAIQTQIGYKPYSNILIISGTKFSGKTHLMNIWQKTYNAKFLDQLFLDNIDSLKYNMFRDIFLKNNTLNNQNEFNTFNEENINKNNNIFKANDDDNLSKLNNSYNSLNKINEKKTNANLNANINIYNNTNSSNINLDNKINENNKNNFNSEINFDTNKNISQTKLKSLSDKMLFEHAKYYIENSNCILEDIETIDEITLITILNMMINSNMQFVLTANIWPLDIKLQDLKDRINSIKQVSILQPDLEMLRIIIIRYFRVRSIKVDEKTISYLAYRLPFDLSLVKQILDDINLRSLIAKTNISIRFLEKTYNGEFEQTI